MTRLFLFWILLYGCVHAEPVASSYQDAFLELVKKAYRPGENTNGYFLVSYSGWSNRGQILIIDQKNTMRAYYVAPNVRLEKGGEPKFHKEMELSADQRKAFLQALPTQKVLNYAEIKNASFDGIEYEFAWVEVTAAGTNIKKRLRMKNLNALPAATPGLKDQQALIKAFQTLFP